MADNQMSFLPEDYVERRIEQRTNFICLTLFVVVLGGVVGAWMVTSRHEAELRDQRQQVNVSYTEAARRLEQLQQLEERRSQMLRKAQVSASLIEPVPRTFLLADLINRMPPTLSLFQWDIHTKQAVAPVLVVKTSKSALSNMKDSKGRQAAEPPPPRYLVTVTMTGVAPTDVQVAQYMAQLSRSPLLEDVNLVFSEEAKIEDQTMRRFRIDMALKPDADVRQVDPLLVPRKPKMNPLESNKLATPAALPSDAAMSLPGVDLLKSALGGGSKEK